jgi:hypothetical protein
MSAEEQQQQQEEEYYHEEEEEEEGFAEGAEGEGEVAGEEDPERLAAELQRQQEKIRQEEEKLKQMMKDVEASSAAAAEGGGEGGEELEGQGQGAVDENSIYVGQVDYEVTPEELQAHFQGCGTINRVTILCDKFTGRPKGWVGTSNPTGGEGRGEAVATVHASIHFFHSFHSFIHSSISSIHFIHSSVFLFFLNLQPPRLGHRFAYVEFLEKTSVDNALKLDNSLLKGRPIKVSRARSPSPPLVAAVVVCYDFVT